MTIQEKAKAYDKAIKEASVAYKDEDKHLKATLERIFPELKESEDEKIIKWIIDDIRYNMDNEPLNNSEYKKKAEKAIAWLEKQGEKPQVIEGAKWADRAMIEKACEWIENNKHFHKELSFGSLSTDWDKFIREFRKAMED